MGMKIGGMVSGASLLAGGLFAMDNAFDAVEKAQTKADKSQNAYNQALITAKTAADKYNKAVQEGGHSQAELNDLLTRAQQAANKVGPAYDMMKMKQEEAAEASSQLAMQMLPAVTMMSSGAAQILTFGRGMSTMGRNAGDAAGGIGKAGGALSGTLGTVLKIALPLAAVAGAYFLLKNNVGGVTDMLNKFGESLGRQVPALLPVLDVIRGIGQAVGILPGSEGLDRIKHGLAGIKDQLAPLKQGAIEAFGTFKTALGQISTGDIGGAFSTIVAGARALGGNIMGAIRSVNWAQVWQGLQDAFNSSVNWIKNTASNIGASVGNFIKNWNWGDAWSSLETAFWSSVDFLNNLRLKANAAVEWILGHIWPALTTVWNTLKEWWGPAKAAYHATINWIADHIWPALQQVWPFLVNAWGQATTAYHFAVKWIADHIWPTIQQVSAAMPTWKDIKNAATMVLNWTISNIIVPTLTEIQKYLPTWKDVKNTASMILGWVVSSVVNPPAMDIIKNAPKYEPIAVEVKMALKFAAETWAFPALDAMVSSLLKSVTTAISNAPGAATAIGGAVKSWFFGLFTTPVTVDSIGVNIKDIVIGGGELLKGDFIAWVKRNMPDTVAAAKQLSVSFAGINFGGMAQAFADAGRDAAAALWNSIRQRLQEAIPGLGASLPRISFGVEMDISKAMERLNWITSQLKTNLPEEKRIRLTAEAQQLISELGRSKTELDKIPKALKTDMKLDTGTIAPSIAGAKRELDKIPPKKTTTATVDTANVNSGVNNVVAALNRIPRTITVGVSVASGAAAVSSAQSSAYAQYQAGQAVARYGAAGIGPETIKKPTLLMVAEEGPEDVYVGKPGSIVPMAKGTRSPMSNWQSGEGGRGTLEQKLDQIVSLLGKISTQRIEQAVEVDLVAEGRRLANVSSKNMGNYSYGDR
jgi:hypothetical protein